MSTATTTHHREGEQSIVHTRRFAAPAALVQQAHTDPQLFGRWMGPRGSGMEIDRFEVTSGGGFDYTVVAGDGRFRFVGVYHLVSPETIVHTWQYYGEPMITLETLHFADHPDGGSELRVVSTYTSRKDCDDMLASGLDSGMDEDFEQLDEVLAAGD